MRVLEGAKELDLVHAFGSLLGPHLEHLDLLQDHEPLIHSPGVSDPSGIDDSARRAELDWVVHHLRARCTTESLPRPISCA